MERRHFIRSAALATAGFYISHDLLARPKGPVYGHHGMRYRLDDKWSKADAARFPVKDCHEMVQDGKGNIYLLTNETKNNVLVFNKSGKLLRSWGTAFPGAHGLTLGNENGMEFLLITDTDLHQVFKTTLDGKVLMTIDYPADSGRYAKKEAFVPTETAVADNGDIYVADGYGAQFILHYDRQGKLKNVFGGRGEGDAHLDNAHGITVDRRNGAPTLLVTDRTRHCFKRFGMDGRLQEVIALPGACVCRPVIRGQYLYAAVLRSPDMNREGSGFVTILDGNNRVVSNIGGTEPTYAGDCLQLMQQAEKVFVHPHDVCVDDDDNLYVAQWASGKVYPYKLSRA